MEVEKAASSSNLHRKFVAESGDILICNICTEAYDNKKRVPKFLTCHHTVCESCLTRVAGDQSSVDCPTCRQVTSLGENGVKGLQSNFYILHIKETMDKIGSPKVKGCSKHSQQPMSFYCERCSVSICRDCTVIDHKEKDGHVIKDVSTAEREQRDILVKKIQSSRETHNLVNGKMKNLDAEIKNLTSAKEKATKDIEKAFKTYQSFLEKRKEALSAELNVLFSKKMQLLKGKMQELEGQNKSLEDMLKVKDDKNAKGTLLEVVTMNNKLSATVENVTKFTKALSVDPNYIQFHDNIGMKELQESTKKLGSFESEKMLPCYIELIPVNKNLIPACQPVTLKFKMFDFKNTQLNDYSIDVQIIDPEKKFLACKTTEAKEEKLYNAKFLPEMSGTHRLFVKFHNHTFKGCEASIEIGSNNPVKIIGAHGTSKGKFNFPRAVGIDGQKNLYVADTGNKLIQKLNSSGTFQEEFSLSGESDNLSTCDLAIDDSNKVIVCTETVLGQNNIPTVGNTIAIYNYNGKCKNRFCNKVMKCALCVATNSKGDIIISDYLVHSLFMYDKNGTFLRRISSPSDGFNHPAFICCDNQDNIIVSDTNNDTVQVFNSQGEFKYQFGKSGTRKGQLKQPFGVATNGSEIVVVDSGNKRVQIFNKNGEFKCMIESKDSAFDQPRGVALSNDGHVFVADRNNHCIKQFKYQLS